MPGDVGAGADGHDHVADLRHRRVGDDPLEVAHHEPDRAGHEQRHRADDHPDRRRGARELEERVQARDEVDAGGHHRRRVDERGDRGGALHRVREPRVQRDLRALGEAPDEDEHEPRREVAVPVRAERLLGDGEGLEEVHRARVAQQEERAEDEADVADDVDDEGLDARGGRRLAAVPERDQQVGGRADEGPPDDEDEEVRRQDEQEHREDEEVQVREEARVAAVLPQVRHRVEVDERRDARDHEDHEHRQRVHEQRDLRVDADGADVVPARDDDLAVLVVERLQLDQDDDGGDEGAEDRGGADPAHRAAGPGAPAERAHQRARQGEQQDEPRGRLERGHPCSSRSSSTSIGSRRR